ncbi:hypothetical protein [Pseudomonas aeruginosa]|uniref:hypothetical protein n=1 Tax=Pseudomonas aeruginosa TaxID=287 RepID=UPI001404B473|nr:hypothetical protein [Pseudomonas aeruginosa]
MISVLEAKNLLSRPGIAPPLFRAVGTPLAAARTRLSSAHEKGRPEAAFLGFA